MTDLTLFDSQACLEVAGWTLLHFLWQGTIIAAVFWCVSVILGPASPNVRYSIGCIALVSMAACPIVSATILYSSSRAALRVAEGLPFPNQTATIEPTIDAPATSQESAANAIHVATHQSNRNAGLSRLTEWNWWKANVCEPLLPWLVGVWIVGVTLLSVRLCFGWIFVQSLRSRGVRKVSDEFDHTLRRLASQLRVSKPVQLLESAFVEVPTLVGFLRPVILLPTSALLGLQPKQLEALLAHELAHIRRHDYLVNLVQTIIETLLFYHPAVWFVSSKVRTSREECCDDLAVQVCGDRVAYARSLTTMESLRESITRREPQLSLSAGGGNLLNRVRRLIKPPARPANRSAGWIIVASGVVVVAALTIIPKRHIHASPAKTTAAIPVAQKDDGWGPEGDGLRVRLSLLTEKPKVGEPLKVRLEIKNISNEVRSYSGQSMVPFRVLKLKRADGSPVAFIAPISQTAGSPAKIEPGATITLWKEVDVINYYLLDKPGKYLMSTAPAQYRLRGLAGAPKDKVSDVPPSNVVAVDLQPGKLREEMAFISHVHDLAPKPWRMHATHDGVIFMHMPTSLKKDVSTVEVMFTQAALPEQQKAQMIKAGYVVDELGKTNLGYANILASKHAKELWPNYVEKIREKLPKSAPQEAMNLKINDMGKSRLSIRVLDPAGNETTDVYVNLWRTIKATDPSNRQRWIDEKDQVWERGRNWSPQYPLPEGGLVFDDIEPGDYRVTAVRFDKTKNADPTPIGSSEAFNVAANESETVTIKLQGGSQLSVRVVDSQSRKPLERTSVQLFRADGMPIVGAYSGTGNFFDRTNQNGEVIYGDLPPGKYRIEMPARAASLNDPIKYEKLPSVTVDLKPGEKETIEIGRVAQPLTAAESDAAWPHSVFGVVTDANGNPMEGVVVRAATGMGTLLGGGQTTTGKDGRYTLRFGKGIAMHKDDEVQLQVATISASKKGYTEKDLGRQGNLMMADLRPPEGVPKGFVGVVLPGKPMEVNFVLVPSAKLRGVIQDANGQPLEGLRVALTGDRLPPSSSVIESTRTGNDGRFEFNDIPTGYSFQFLIQPAKAKPPWLGWASPRMQFLQPGSRAIHAIVGKSEFIADHLVLQIEGPGINWKTALKQAAQEEKLDAAATDSQEKMIDGKTQLQTNRLCIKLKM